MKITKSVPIPTNAPGRKSKYPFMDMDVGDSFLVSGTCGKNLRAAATFTSSKYGLKFTVRKVPGGHRCWRIE